MTTTIDTAQAAAPDLSRGRLYAMRVGYPLMGVGRALVNWPTLLDVHALPLYEGVTWCPLLAQAAWGAAPVEPSPGNPHPVT